MRIFKFFSSPKKPSQEGDSSPSLSVWPFLQNKTVQAIVYVFIAAVHLLLISAPLMQRLEFVFLDVFFRNRPALAMNESIVFVEIAQDSIDKIGRWPWPRRYHAALTSILNQWEVHSIVFDAFFSESSLEEIDDAAFSEALAKKKNVYAGVVIEDAPFVAGKKLPEGENKIWVHSIPEIEKNLRGVGHVNVSPDVDGITRHVSVSLTQNGESHRYLGVEIANDYLRGHSPSLKVTPSLHDRNGVMLINWAERWENSFRHYSYWDVLQSYEAIQKGEKPVISPEEFKDKIVLIGVTASGLTDIKGVPIQAIFPGVGVIANVANSILTNQFIREANWQENAIALMIIAMGMGFLFWTSSKLSTWVSAIFFAGFWVVVAYLIFLKIGIYFQVVNPLLLILNFFIFSILVGFLRSQSERSIFYQLATRDGLTGLFVIRHMRGLLEQAREWALKKNHPVSVMMTDIDFFKKINDGFGHDAGDCVLKDIARLMELELTEKNEAGRRIRVGRYGGEEFIILIENCDAELAGKHYAEAVRARVEAFQFRYQGKAIPVTLSLGVAELEPGDKNMDDAIKRADNGLYRAKHGGRNQVQIVRGTDLPAPVPPVSAS